MCFLNWNSYVNKNSLKALCFKFYRWNFMIGAGLIVNYRNFVNFSPILIFLVALFQFNCIFRQMYVHFATEYWAFISLTLAVMKISSHPSLKKRNLFDFCFYDIEEFASNINPYSQTFFETTRGSGNYFLLILRIVRCHYYSKLCSSISILNVSNYL